MYEYLLIRAALYLKKSRKLFINKYFYPSRLSGSLRESTENRVMLLKR